jgi:hypothetical protein
MEIFNHLKRTHDCTIADFNSVIDPKKQYDIILYSSASIYNNHEKFNELMDNQKNCQIGWITNEFELFANDFVKRRMTFMITNFEESGIKRAHRHDQLLVTNLNTLIAKPRNPLCEKKYKVCYYGTWRKYRQEYFKKYFKDDMIVSTSQRNFRKFEGLDRDFNVTDKFSWEQGQETLNLFEASLYIEDSKTHDCFNYLANRFYEALFCNTAVFFDKSCQNTIDKSVKYKINKYFVVDSLDELNTKLETLDPKMLLSFLSYNTQVALKEKQETLNDIESFLLELL